MRTMTWVGAFALLALVPPPAVRADEDASPGVSEIEPPPAPAGKAWKLVWSDEFDGDRLDEAKWEVQEGRRRDGWWSPKAVALDGKGRLEIRTLKDGDRFLDGCIRSRGRFEHAYGYYAARVRLQKQPGHWSAFWLYNASVNRVGDDGRDGTEIDIYEKPWLDDRVQHALHWDGYGKEHRSGKSVARVPGVQEGFHTFGLWWKPDEYVFSVDGKETWRTAAGGVCRAPLYLKLSDEIGAWGGDIRKAALPDAFVTDYVRVYDLVDAGADAHPAKAAAAAGAGFVRPFYELCDLACRELNAPTRTVPFYNDSYAVRALAAAYDLSRNPRYLEVCRAWSDRMIGLQEKMIPAGAYFMNYQRKPGEETGGWYVADSSSIAMGILATAVRGAEPAARERYLASVRSFADLVLDNYLGPGGGVRNGLWPKSKDEWWCSSGIFGSLMFLLHRETGDPRYLQAGRGAIDWLNGLDWDTAGPLTFREMGATMPMYVLEAYSAAWPFLEPGSQRREGAEKQLQRVLAWMEKTRPDRDRATAKDFHSQWGSKTGGLPFHLYVYAQANPGRDAVVPVADRELRRALQAQADAPGEGLPQIVVFALMSLAERVGPGRVYRSSK